MEIVIVLAISSMLLLIVIQGLSHTRGQAQFQSAIEQAKEQVLARRAEALSNINSATPSLGITDPCTVTLGRLLTFKDGLKDVQVDELTAPNPVNRPITCLPAAVGSVTANASISDFTLKWGVTFKAQVNKPNYLAFTRSLTDNSLHAVALKSLTLPLTYSELTTTDPTLATPVEFEFADPDGRSAFLTIDQLNAGVTRRYN